jgi:hypothetical protein
VQRGQLKLRRAVRLSTSSGTASSLFRFFRPAEYECKLGKQVELFNVLREKILAVVTRHVNVDPDKVQITVDRGPKFSTLAVDVEIPNSGPSCVAIGQAHWSTAFHGLRVLCTSCAAAWLIDLPVAPFQWGAFFHLPRHSCSRTLGKRAIGARRGMRKAPPERGSFLGKRRNPPEAGRFHELCQRRT